MDVAIETAATILRYHSLKARQREAVKAFMQGNDVLQTKTTRRRHPAKFKLEC